MSQELTSKSVWKLPVFGVVAAIIVLVMLRLGVWQLGRAEEKQVILDAVLTRSSQTPIDILSLDRLEQNAEDLRFTPVTVTGVFLAEKTIFVDRQVVQGKVGYQVFTPLQVAGAAFQVMVARGWVAVGSTRAVLPVIETPTESIQLRGRLNTPPSQPPLWDDAFSVADGAVWQYLPMAEVASQMQLNLMPLVVELAPETSAPAALLIDWPAIDDQWVAKHTGYAFQWFAMAFAFFIACLVLVFKNISRKS